MRSNSWSCEKQRSQQQEFKWDVMSNKWRNSAWRQINSISRQLLEFILEIKRNKTFQEKRMLRMHDQSFLAYTKLRPPCCSNKLAANGLKCLEKLTSYVHTLLSCTHTSNTASVDSWQLQIAEHVDKTERLRTKISMWRRAVSGFPQQKAVTRTFTTGMLNKQLKNVLK